MKKTIQLFCAFCVIIIISSCTSINSDDFSYQGASSSEADNSFEESLNDVKMSDNDFEESLNDIEMPNNEYDENILCSGGDEQHFIMFVTYSKQELIDHINYIDCEEISINTPDLNKADRIRNSYSELLKLIRKDGCIYYPQYLNEEVEIFDDPDHGGMFIIDLPLL
ncbi:MAG: hypothetical protein PHD66_02870 [Eubacteriales bacterium]|nr:hypothetical protein [Eubacteriales bacterium]